MNKPLQCCIREIDALEHADTVLAHTNQHSLVVFDVDETLICPSDTAQQKWFRQSPAGIQFFKELRAHKAKPGDTELQGPIWAKMYRAEQSRTIEPHTTQIIRQLQQRGIKVIALTNCKTGISEPILSIEAWRYEKLAHVGIDLSTSFELQEINLQKVMHTEKTPLFYKGILSTDLCDKGATLGAFLDVIGFNPDQIIFFDDAEKNVESVQKEADARGITYHGFVYTAAAKLPQIYDPAIIELQRDYLIECDKYISEKQAHKLLKNRTRKKPLRSKMQEI